MDAIIDGCFERVELALAKLVQSIAVYNPSTTLADDLVNADAQLTEGLHQLSIHQANYAKILSLREEAIKLDNTIKETASMLRDLRREALDIPATTFPENTYPVEYSELLSYARRINKYTLPPAGYKPAVAAVESTEKPAGQEGSTGPPTNSTSTPAPINGINKDTPMGGMGVVSEVPGGPSQEAGLTRLPEDMQAMLVAQGINEFQPWPSDDLIKGGALAQLKILKDEGKDPATFSDVQKETELEQQRLLLEKEARDHQEAERTRDEERIREAQRRASTHGNPTGNTRAEHEKKTFTLETFESDSEGDD